jgi:hypothetical protein
MRFFSIISVVTLLLGLPSPAAAAAQEQTVSSPASTVTSGSRVRVRSTTVQGRIRGVVTDADETVLTIIPEGGGPLKVPVGSITGMDVSLGRHRNWLKGLGIGMAAGVALGFAMPVDPLICHDPTQTYFCSRAEAIVGGTFLFGPIGAGIGALIKSDRWAPVSVGLGAPNHGTAKGRGFQATAAVQF